MARARYPPATGRAPRALARDGNNQAGRRVGSSVDDPALLARTTQPTHRRRRRRPAPRRRDPTQPPPDTPTSRCVAKARAESRQ